MKKLALVSLAAFAAIGAAAPVLADDDRPHNREGWLSIEQISARLGGLGYTAIREIDVDDGLYEIEARNAEGRSVELKVHPKTGEVLHSERDD